jgi:secondary thiamine-phosphate synthase enzyme
MDKLETLSILTERPVQFINITEKVVNFVTRSNLKDGLVAIMTSHTTTGILLQENLECLEIDMEECLERLVPNNVPYAHAHFLRSYGATGNNSAGHLKAILVGNNCLLPVIEGKVLKGSAQDIFLAEFDGPQLRKVFLQVIGG